MLLLCESFGSFSTTAALAGRGWLNDDDTKITLGVGNGPHGGNTIQMVDADALPVVRTGIERALRNAGDPDGLVRVAFSFKNDGYTGNTPEVGGEALIMLRSSAENTGIGAADAPSWSINLSSSGTIQIEDMTDSTGNFRNAVATGSANITDTSWHDIEVEFQVGESSDGACKVWVDGVLDVNVSSLTTAKVGFDLTMVDICDVSMGKAVLPPTAPNTCWFGHILIWDDRGDSNALKGALPTHRIRIDCRRPVGDAGPNDWVLAGSATHSGAVSEGSYDGDTSHIQSGVKYARDMHSYQPLGFTPTEDIIGVVMVSQNRNSVGGTQDFRMITVDESDIFNGADTTLTADYESYDQFFIESPDGSEWTEGSFNSALFGVEPRDGT